MAGAAGSFWNARTLAAIKAGEDEALAERDEALRAEWAQTERRAQERHAQLPRADPASLRLVSKEALTTFSEATGARPLGVNLVTSIDPGQIVRPLLYERLQVELAVANADLIDNYRHDFERVVPTFAVPERCFMVITDGLHDRPDDDPDVIAERQAFGPMGERQCREALARGFGAEIIARVNKTLGDPDVIKLVGGRDKVQVPLLFVPRATALLDWKTLPISEDGVAALRLVLPAKGSPDMHREMVYFALQRLLLDMLPRPQGESGEVLEFAYYVQLTAVELFVRWTSEYKCRRAGLRALPPDNVIYDRLSKEQQRAAEALKRQPKLTEAMKRQPENAHLREAPETEHVDQQRLRVDRDAPVLEKHAREDQGLLRTIQADRGDGGSQAEAMATMPELDEYVPGS